ncbi:hypothetical protein, partial [Mesorhizobium wenxiniae]|uniref:hypothetical protein n=1 Tax=Mesorhizobium wenxiniae TaxID=2014805 RepID=UPI00197D149C
AMRDTTRKTRIIGLSRCLIKQEQRASGYDTLAQISPADLTFNDPNRHSPIGMRKAFDTD